MATEELRDRLQAALGDAYSVERELPAGGMSRLFLATERSLNRRVVIKLLPPEYASEVSVARFQREVTLTAQLQHPHILPILSAASKGGLLYYVMPYVAGESLRQRLARDGRLPVATAIQLLREVADALARAHEAGVVHRDIKPENILLQHDHALLADFGVARALHEVTGAGRLTDTGTGLGTPAYMAPEQLAGERNVDARADVYALAVVGYEMLAGVAPFAGPTPQAVAAAHFSAALRPLMQLRTDVPQSVSAAIGKALAQEPDQRFATATDFRDALAPTAARSAFVTARRALVGGVAAILLIAIATVGTMVVRARAARANEPPLLAVLPFENLGDSSDAYFADGLTDQVRGKLTAVPGLRVIASASSNQYRHTTKSPQEIGRELGVTYLLVGRIRWDKHQGADAGETRLLVEPELVEVHPGQPPTSRWAAPFDTPFTKIFDVQANIAERVTQALQITLSPAVYRAVVAPPTANLDAYDAYLRARALVDQSIDATVGRRAIDLFREALTRDSAFTLAWVGLSKAYLIVQMNATELAGRAAVDSARIAAMRALTLAPDLAAAHAAMGLFYVVSGDSSRAFAECKAGLARSPNDPDALFCLSDFLMDAGRLDEAEQTVTRLTVVDPQGPFGLNMLGYIQAQLHHFVQARATLDRAIAVNPTNLTAIGNRTGVEIAEGDLDGARAVLRAVPVSVDPTVLAVHMARIEEIPWVLDTTLQRKLLAANIEAFDGDTIYRGLTFAQLFAIRGDLRRSRAYADTALRTLSAAVAAAPHSAHDRLLRGLALAYAGRYPEALREAEVATQLNEPGSRLWRARIYTMAGEHDRAVGLLDTLLRTPESSTDFLTARWLRIDPNFAPLRGDPRFERLIADTAAAGD